VRILGSHAVPFGKQMKITLIGGGGFRTPLTYQALLGLSGRVAIDELTLYDTDAVRLARISQVLTGLDHEQGRSLRRSCTTDLDRAVDGADFVLCAIRVGGLAGRAIDERLALAEGLIGQETTGAGGIAFALRTVPVMLRIASTVARRAPHAWFVNFTNPVGLVTEALQSVLGPRAIGICDTPIALSRRVAAVLGASPDDLWFEYFGLNHLGWLAAVRDGRGDRLPALLADPGSVASFEEGRLFGAEWLRELGLIPNEYLVYYYNAERVVGTVVERGFGRADWLMTQQARFYERRSASPAAAVHEWRAVTAERDRTYLAEAGREAELPAHTGGGVSGEGEHGYASVATTLIDGLSRNQRSVMIVNTTNRGALGGLDADAVVEVPAIVSSAGVAPLAVGEVPRHALALMQTVKEVERTAIQAAVSGSTGLAVRALALHPLVQSVDRAQRLFAAYRAAQPLLQEQFG
jgi:6-phospho-beta-glucosidase